MGNVLVLATRNQGKIEELRKMLARYDIQVNGVDQYPECPEVEEDGDTFLANAKKKAETISNLLQLPALADDSGLEVDALEGKPGVYSARFAGPEATDLDNILKLLESLKDVPAGERNARFRCALALAIPGKPTWTCEGSCEGQIILSPQGTKGFGYDPVFYLPSLEKTMAQLSHEEKNAISHRGKAVKIFTEQIDTLLNG